MPLDQRPTGASQSFNHPFCLYFPSSFGAPHSSINICPQLGFFSGSFPSFPFFPYFPFPRPIPPNPLVANSFFLLSQQSTAPQKDHSLANSLFYFGQIILHFRLSLYHCLFLPFDNIYSPSRHISSSQFFQPPNSPFHPNSSFIHFSIEKRRVSRQLSIPCGQFIHTNSLYHVRRLAGRSRIEYSLKNPSSNPPIRSTG